ncbi:hypothetical protein A1Q1_01175 [Trichosporon asahii var. asahii CBS 2479]|uniref:Uncharacterized protein n=1 Tax=Trichosporon asahii var. asahii (strain ATCC 90039 / CBS 2479 / JCM 2466 / KCTC 7840 / NBRC 103889/ NCYC 2677 / UAMH 7654) TaxID=1186058 RepID=J6F389_TRIAS|nr:hypothetical protein A1Q1_01175 [Trichosporon asahii var. asahii CBS 2479]EJT49677.1 hypothetical protein A1Q1_01175 [Trichosporon asahii var. asahii CBS 2479]
MFGSGLLALASAQASLASSSVSAQANASEAAPPMVGGTLATPTWAPPNVPCDPEQVTWFYQATFTYAHKCSEACNKWYGLLYKYGTYTGPLSAGQREPDGKYVIEPEVTCPDKYRNINPHVDPLGSAAINDLCHTKIVGCFGDVDCSNLTDPTGRWFYNSTTGAYNNRSPGGDSVDVNAKNINPVPLSEGQGRTSGAPGAVGTITSQAASGGASSTESHPSSPICSTSSKPEATSGASAAAASQVQSADSSATVGSVSLVLGLGMMTVLTLLW